MTDYRNIRDRSYRREELSSRFPNISEEEKFYKEVIGEIAIWHTPEEVYEVYQQHHQQGKTIKAILSSIKFSEIRQREAIDRQSEVIGELSNLQKQSEENRKDFDKIYRELERGIERVDKEVKEALLIMERPASLVFYNKNGIKITEDDMRKIFYEYFYGTDLENVKYNWGEILDPEYLNDILELYKISQQGAETSEIIELLVGISTKLKKSIDSINDTNKKKTQRAAKENDIRVWVLSVGVNKLKGSILSDPKRVAINYKVDKGETAPILTEINHRINRQFRTNFTPIDWIPWIIVGIVALVCLGLWFAGRRRRIRR